MAAKKILILSTEYGTERDELVVPMEKLKELGHDVTLATPSGDAVQTSDTTGIGRRKCRRT